MSGQNCACARVRMSSHACLDFFTVLVHVCACLRMRVWIEKQAVFSCEGSCGLGGMLSLAVCPHRVYEKEQLPV